MSTDLLERSKQVISHSSSRDPALGRSKFAGFTEIPALGSREEGSMGENGGQL